jgi:parallel beta-helix repeat protein
MKKITILLTVLIAMTINVNAQTDVSGSISTNTVWIIANSPYIVIGNVLVNNGVTLTIEPGVTVKFNSLLSIQIDGTLIAQGTSSDSITFTSNTVNTAGAWGYIYFSDASVDAVYENDIYGNYLSGSILEYCKIQYAGGATVSDNGALRFDNAHPFVNYCTISDNSASGINAYNLTGSLKITNSLISNNTSSDYGGGIHISSDGTTLISGNTISKNYASSSGGGICNMFETVIISNNIITDNTTGGDGGGIASGLGGVCESPITNNIIMNNIASEAGGIYIYNGINSSIISNNIITNNKATYWVGGIYAYLGDATISNNVISDNSTTGTNGGIWTLNASYSIHNNHIIRNTATDDAGIRFDNAYINLNTIAFNKNTDFNNTLNRCISMGNSTALVLNNNNIFNNSAFYELYNDNEQGTPNVVATNNWWGTADDATIQGKIYDWFDDNSLGIVNYSPYLSTPDTLAPVSPPANVTKTNIGGGQVKITWIPNPEPDIAGYHVYYGGFNGYSFTDSVNVGNDTSYVLTGVPITDTIGVTAYDSTYSLANEYDSTIVNDNMTYGYESWYAYAESECNSITLSMTSFDASCSTCNDGTATATISLGLTPYTYLWNTTPAQDSSTATGLLPETYTVTITDNNGCVLTDSVVVSFTTSINEEVNSSVITIYPNPVSNIFTLNVNINSNEILTLNIYNVIGSLVKTEALKQNQQQINVGDLDNGIYIVEIKFKGLIRNQKLIIQR